MGDPFVQKTGQKKDWALTPRAFHRLLSWLGEDAVHGGQKYLEIRRRLVAYFDRKNCPAPDDLADEALNRVARRIEEEGSIDSETPAKYCYIVARFVFMEHLRSAQKVRALIDDMRRQPGNQFAGVETENVHAIEDRMLSCLER
jgi:DNA-directed RNA polymerase specialized sigma24 family protein